MFGIPLIGLALPYVCACPNARLGFLTSYVMVFVMFNELRLEVIVHFIDIGGLVDNYCLNFLFIYGLLTHTRLILPNT